LYVCSHAKQTQRGRCAGQRTLVPRHAKKRPSGLASKKELIEDHACYIFIRLHILKLDGEWPKQVRRYASKYSDLQEMGILHSPTMLDCANTRAHTHVHTLTLTATHTPPTHMHTHTYTHMHTHTQKLGRHLTNTIIHILCHTPLQCWTKECQYSVHKSRTCKKKRCDSPRVNQWRLNPVLPR